MIKKRGLILWGSQSCAADGVRGAKQEGILRKAVLRSQTKPNPAVFRFLLSFRTGAEQKHRSFFENHVRVIYSRSLLNKPADKSRTYMTVGDRVPKLFDNLHMLEKYL